MPAGLAGAALAVAVYTPALDLRIVRPSGLDFVQRNSPASQKYGIETMCGGVALLDYVKDGLLDILLANGGHIDDPVKTPTRFSRRDPAYWNWLFRQNKDGRFTDVTEKAGLGRESEMNYGMGVATGDFDGDGCSDIFVSNDGMERRLLHNNGNGTFTDHALEAGVALMDDGKAVSGRGADFSDYDDDGRPDIGVTDLAAETWEIYHNEGGGRFSYASSSSGLAALSAMHSGWGVGWREFDKVKGEKRCRCFNSPTSLDPACSTCCWIWGKLTYRKTGSRKPRRPSNGSSQSTTPTSWRELLTSSYRRYAESLEAAPKRTNRQSAFAS